MTADQIHLLRKSFATVEQQAHVAALVFYRRLFELQPGLRRMFKTDIEEQADKLMDMLSLALSLAERPAAMERELLESGARHATYGVVDDQYAVVREAMIHMLSEVLGNALTPATLQAWAEFYDHMADTMKRGAAQVTATSQAQHTRSIGAPFNHS